MSCILCSNPAITTGSPYLFCQSCSMAFGLALQVLTSNIRCPHCRPDMPCALCSVKNGLLQPNQSYAIPTAFNCYLPPQNYMGTPYPYPPLPHLPSTSRDANHSPQQFPNISNLGNLANSAKHKNPLASELQPQRVFTPDSTGSCSTGSPKSSYDDESTILDDVKRNVNAITNGVNETFRQSNIFPSQMQYMALNQQQQQLYSPYVTNQYGMMQQYQQQQPSQHLRLCPETGPVVFSENLPQQQKHSQTEMQQRLSYEHHRQRQKAPQQNQETFQQPKQQFKPKPGRPKLAKQLLQPPQQHQEQQQQQQPQQQQQQQKQQKEQQQNLDLRQQRKRKLEIPSQVQIQQQPTGNVFPSHSVQQTQQHQHQQQPVSTANSRQQPTSTIYKPYDFIEPKKPVQLHQHVQQQSRQSYLRPWVDSKKPLVDNFQISVSWTNETIQYTLVPTEQAQKSQQPQTATTTNLSQQQTSPQYKPYNFIEPKESEQQNQLVQQQTRQLDLRPCVDSDKPLADDCQITDSSTKGTVPNTLRPTEQPEKSQQPQTATIYNPHNLIEPKEPEQQNQLVQQQSRQSNLYPAIDVEKTLDNDYEPISPCAKETDQYTLDSTELPQQPQTVELTKSTQQPTRNIFLNPYSSLLPKEPEQKQH